MEAPLTHLEAIVFFSNQENCHNYLMSKRWPDGQVICPHCISKNVGGFSRSRRIWNCKDCRKQFSIKVGTIFENSPLGLDKWLAAMWIIANAKNGASSCELARTLGITQKSAWFMGHRIRLAFQQGSIDKLKGTVEADETFVGMKASNMHKSKRREKVKGTGPIAMIPIFGALERGTEDRPSQVRLKVLNSRKRPDIHGGVSEFVEDGSKLYTDALRSYNGLNERYTHKTVDHAFCYVMGDVHTNGMENFWSLLKRTIKGTYICPSRRHLFRYLDEQAFRFNERTGNDSNRFDLAVSEVSGKRIRYRELISKSA
ncbi:Transposase [Prosthecobacter debontii]|uniref:Transposase n=1 Tax=Prosthecobacter debontii TaxID=48467 RepID=A0A1T4YER1_9BACT|nr:IS1595 family transposase [Prosthecobacter debontii]SKB00193.1 Transposase [Prosthecobacter debontii]